MNTVKKDDVNCVAPLVRRPFNDLNHSKVAPFTCLFTRSKSLTIEANSLAKLPDGKTRWVAWNVAGFIAIWRITRRKGILPITHTMVRLIGQELTFTDRKAREELGYTPIVTRDFGLAELADFINKRADKPHQAFQAEIQERQLSDRVQVRQFGCLDRCEA